MAKMLADIVSTVSEDRSELPSFIRCRTSNERFEICERGRGDQDAHSSHSNGRPENNTQEENGRGG